MHKASEYSVMFLLICIAVIMCLFTIGIYSKVCSNSKSNYIRDWDFGRNTVPIEIHTDTSMQLNILHQSKPLNYEF